MTKEDEREFSRQLLEALPEISFIDIDCWATLDPIIRSSIADCSSRWGNIGLLNKQIMPLKSYCSEYIQKTAHGYYQGGSVGRGLIQYLRPKEEKYDPLGFKNGSLTSSYHIDRDIDTDIYVKTVYKIFKKGAKKLYYINPMTGSINNKPETRFFAWPDAVQQYDMANEKYLCNHAIAYFTSKHDAQLPEYLTKKLKERAEAHNRI